MRMKLGTLKRIIREAVEAQINEVWRSDAEIEATRRAAETFPFRNKRAEEQVAADRERQAAQAKASAEYHAAQSAAWPDKNAKYLAVLKALPAALSAVGFSDPDPKSPKNPENGAFRLKSDVMEHPGLNRGLRDPNMTVDAVAANVAAAAHARNSLAVKSKYDR